MAILDGILSVDVGNINAGFFSQKLITDSKALWWSDLLWKRPDRASSVMAKPAFCKACWSGSRAEMVVVSDTRVVSYATET